MQSYFLPIPRPTPLRFLVNKCTLYSSLIAAAVELSLSESKLVFQPHKDFLLFSPQVHFLSVDIKGSQKSFDIALFFFFSSSPQLCGDAASLPQTGSVLAHSFVSLLLSRSIAPYNPLSHSIRSSCSYWFHHTLISSVTGGGLTRRAGY